jgi:hypothetical protein
MCVEPRFDIPQMRETEPSPRAASVAHMERSECGVFAAELTSDFPSRSDDYVRSRIALRSIRATGRRDIPHIFPCPRLMVARMIGAVT